MNELFATIVLIILLIGICFCGFILGIILYNNVKTFREWCDLWADKKHSK